MSVSEEVAKSFSQVPANNEFGFTLIARAKDEAVVSMKVRPEYTQETGVLHGGILATIADTAATYLFHPDLGENQTIGSVELKMNYLRPALLGEGPVVAKSRLVQRGHKIGVCDVEALRWISSLPKAFLRTCFLKATSSWDGHMRTA